MTRKYPSNWSSIRKEVYKRDDYKCQNCGKEGSQGANVELHAHHIVPKKKGGSDNKNNLKTLCVDCHNAIHHKDKMAPTRKGHPVDGEAMNESERRSRGIIWWTFIFPIKLSIWLTVVLFKLFLLITIVTLRITIIAPLRLLAKLLSD